MWVLLPWYGCIYFCLAYSIAQGDCMNLEGSVIVLEIYLHMVLFKNH